MTDTTLPEPVAFAHVEDGNLYCLSPHKSKLSPTALYTADQVKKLTDRIVGMMDQYYDLLEDHTTAEVALDSARNVIGELLQCQDGVPMTGIEAQRRADAARQWLSANQKETPNAE